MSDQESIDIFEELQNTNFEDIDTTYPILKPGVYACKVRSVERKPWANGKGSSLVINLALNEGGESVDGRAINPGYTIIDRISLVKSDSYDPRVSVALFLDAVDMRDQPFDINAYTEQSLFITTKIETDPNGRYPDKAAVARYMRPDQVTETSGTPF